MKKTRAYSLVVALCFLALGACAQLGAVQPKSLDQQLAYAQGAITAARISATNALKARTISSADAQKALDLTDTATAAVQAARTAEGSGDLSTAQSKLQAANSVLVHLQSYLASKGVK